MKVGSKVDSAPTISSKVTMRSLQRTSEFRLQSAATTRPILQHLPSFVSPDTVDCSVFNAVAKIRVGSKLDCAASISSKVKTRSFQRTESAMSPGDSNLVTHDHKVGDGGLKLGQENCHTLDRAGAEGDNDAYEGSTMGTEKCDLDFMDPDCEVRNEVMEHDEELPVWYKEQVRSKRHVRSFCVSVQANHKKVKEEPATSGDRQAEGVKIGGESDNFHFHSLDVENSAAVVSADQTTLLIDEAPKASPDPDPTLIVTFERALTLAPVRNAASFRDALQKLYNFTKASLLRGPFLLPNTSHCQAATGRGQEGQRIDGKDSTVVLIPKEEPVLQLILKEETGESDSSQRWPADLPMVEVTQEKDSSWSLVSSSEDMESHRKVRDVLEHLEDVWIKRCREEEEYFAVSSGERFRPDLIHQRVGCELRRQGLWLNRTTRPIGHCPGVPVGACFNYRIEMIVIGLHLALQSGIAVIPAELSPYARPFAPSVVLRTSCLEYKDDKDMGDTIIYSGHGGFCAKTKKYRDQKLERGNLALANSFELGVPIRLIRGHTDRRSRTGRLYSYDGLYTVTRMSNQFGVHGNRVYLFTMVRLPGQGCLPVPSKAALIYRGEDDTDDYLQQRKESRSRKLLKYRSPVLRIKPTAAGSEVSMTSVSPPRRTRSLSRKR